jgi:hypothetical protein
MKRIILAGVVAALIMPAGAVASGLPKVVRPYGPPAVKPPVLGVTSSGSIIWAGPYRTGRSFGHVHWAFYTHTVAEATGTMWSIAGGGKKTGTVTVDYAHPNAAGLFSQMRLVMRANDGNPYHYAYRLVTNHGEEYGRYGWVQES